MVGVAGRSKGCVTCRQRRVKCDEGKPTCERCRKAGRTCGGYVLNNFVDGLPRKVREHAGEAEPKAGDSPPDARDPPPKADRLPPKNAVETTLVVRSPQLPHKKPQPPKPPSDSGSSGSDDDPASVSEYASRRATPGSMTSTEDLLACDADLEPVAKALRKGFGFSVPLDLTGFQDAIFVSYTTTHMLKGVEPIVGPSMQELTQPGGLLAHDSLVTVSTTYFGYRHNQPHIVQLGRQRYGQALGELNRALAHPTQSKSIMVLNSVVRMTLVEFIAPTTLYGWVNHAMGLMRLFAHRGAAAHTHGEAKWTFEYVRPTIALACIAAEEPCLLATPDWCMLPWSEDPGSKVLSQYITDVLVYLPPHMAGSSRYFDAPKPTSDEVQGMIDSTIGFRTGLDQLEHFWALLYMKRSTDYWTEPMDRRGLAPDNVPQAWDSVYCFDSLLLASAFAMYHAARVLCLNMLRANLTRLAADGQHAALAAIAARDTRHRPTDAAECVRLVSEAYDSGIEICRSVDFHLGPERDGAGSLFLVWPLRMAWMSVGGDNPEGRWIKHITASIGKGRRGAWAGILELVYGRYRGNHGVASMRRQT